MKKIIALFSTLMIFIIKIRKEGVQYGLVWNK